MKDHVRRQIKEAGYSDSQIREGIEYAEEKGYSDAKELGSLVVSRILYSDSQLERGERFEFISATMNNYKLNDVTDEF